MWPLTEFRSHFRITWPEIEKSRIVGWCGLMFSIIMWSFEIVENYCYCSLPYEGWTMCKHCRVHWWRRARGGVSDGARNGGQWFLAADRQVQNIGSTISSIIRWTIVPTACPNFLRFECPLWISLRFDCASLWIPIASPIGPAKVRSMGLAMGAHAFSPPVIKYKTLARRLRQSSDGLMYPQRAPTFFASPRHPRHAAAPNVRPSGWAGASVLLRSTLAQRVCAVTWCDHVMWSRVGHRSVCIRVVYVYFLVFCLGTVIGLDLRDDGRASSPWFHIQDQDSRPGIFSRNPRAGRDNTLTWPRLGTHRFVLGRRLS